MAANFVQHLFLPAVLRKPRAIFELIQASEIRGFHVDELVVVRIARQHAVECAFILEILGHGDAKRIIGRRLAAERRENVRDIGKRHHCDLNQEKQSETPKP